MVGPVSIPIVKFKIRSRFPVPGHQKMDFCRRIVACQGVKTPWTLLFIFWLLSRFSSVRTAGTNLRVGWWLSLLNRLRNRLLLSILNHSGLWLHRLTTLACFIRRLDLNREILNTRNFRIVGKFVRPPVRQPGGPSGVSGFCLWIRDITDNQRLP